MRQGRLCVTVAVALLSGCFADGPFRTPIREQRLPSGKVVKVVSCLLAWGVEHDERHPDQDGFSLEYLSSPERLAPRELEREVVEVFELIRPLSEQWGLTTASVTALRTPERTGTYDAFAFRRSAEGTWSHTVLVITRKTE